MKLKFIGSTQDVTGSKTLIETSSGNILIDCGLYQGLEVVMRKNIEPPSFNIKDIKAIILTHAHLDHSGYIPRLVRLGFRGAIYCTKPTMKLARVILSDSAELMEKKKNHFMSDFYDSEDAGIAFGLFHPIDFDKEFKFLALVVTFLPAGHILGASSVKLQYADKTWIFSGDLGRRDDPLMKPPLPCPKADLVVMESTYGNRNRQKTIESELALFLKKVKAENKVAIVASFAVARAQMLLTLIHKFYLENPKLKVRVVFDGPMMTAANKIYTEFADEMNLPAELKYALNNTENIEHMREFESISKSSGPLIIISSSGMVTGGRIWRYLINFQDREDTILFLPGYQGEGTPGKFLKEGAREIHDEEKNKIRWSGEVLSSEAFSSHADQNELLYWTQDLSKETLIYLNHGEEEAKITLQEKLKSLGFKNCQIATNT